MLSSGDARPPIFALASLFTFLLLKVLFTFLLFYLFTLKSSFYFSIKPCLQCNQALFVMQSSLVCRSIKPYLQHIKFPTFVFRLYCCPVKTSSYGFREAGPLCETHCKPRSGAAVGGKDTRDGSPKGDLCHWRSAGCVSPASRNTILSCSYTHSCTARRLAMGFA